MARLYDMVVAPGLCSLPALMGGEYSAAIMEPSALRRLGRTMMQSTVIIADNVAEYFFDGSDKEVWQPEDFPAALPPLSPVFLEFRAPSFVTSEVGGRFPWHRPERAWGWLVETRAREPAGWTVLYTLFVDQRGTPGAGIMGPMLQFDVDVDERGALPPRSNLRAWRCASAVPASDPRALDFYASAEPLLDPVHLTFSFMHCKNIKQREVVPPAILRQPWKKKHGRPLVRYRVLDIDPMRKVLKSEGRSDEVGLKKALHICRGHFATYTEDAPLFGRVTGTFWKPQHVRGSAKHGAVVKDYRVGAPA